MKIVVGGDPFGCSLKEEIKKHLQERGIEVIDIGGSEGKDIPYYEVAAIAAEKIQKGEADKGILFCGTGMGVAIVANKFKGIYASVVESEFSGQHCKVINNSNILTMGAMIIAPPLAKRIVDKWLDAKLAEGYPEFADFIKDSLNKISEIEAKTMR